MICDLFFCNHESRSSIEQPCYINFDTTYIRGNTPHSECPKAPPARREGSSRLFAMNGIVFRKPAKAKKGETNDSLQKQEIGYYL